MFRTHTNLNLAPKTITFDHFLSSIDKVAAGGPGLAFITYPLGVVLMPQSKYWATAFFFMLITLGFGSHIVTVQGQITALYDILPQKIRYRKEFLSLVVCVVCFLVGIPFTFKSGIWTFLIFDTFAASGTTLQHEIMRSQEY